MKNERGDMMGSRLRQVHKIDKANYLRDCKKNFFFFKYNYLKHMPQARNSQILDIGAGLGQFIYFCKKMGYNNVMGIDLSRENVSFCKEQGYDVEFKDAPLFLKQTKTKFDVIVLNDVLEHIPKDKIIPFLMLIKNRLKPGGVFIQKTINMADPIMGVHSRYIDFTHEIGWTEESVRQVLEQAGFALITVLPSNIFVFYANPINYIALLVSKMFGIFFICYYRLNGRPNTRIFTKNLISVARV